MNKKAKTATEPKLKKENEAEQKAKKKTDLKLKSENKADRKSKQKPEKKADLNSKQEPKAGAEKNSQHYIYILECADKTLYTGYTNNLEKRVATHQSGKGAKYTKTRLPVLLKYYEIFEDKESAMKREWFIKHKLTREDKLKLISSSNDLFQGRI